MYATENFKPEEFYCPCCGKESMDDDFIMRIQLARTLSGIPFRITSGYRCEKYQENLRKRGYETANGVSPHEKGVACDISVSSDKDRFMVLEKLRIAGLDRYGLGSNFIHVDMDKDRNANRLWHYKR